MSTAIDPLRGAGEQRLKSLLRELGPTASSQSSPDSSLHPTFGEIGYGYRAGRSLGISIAAHVLAIPVVLLLAQVALHPPQTTVRRSFAELRNSASVLTLPLLGGGREGSGQRGGGSGNHAKLSSGLRARSRRGFAYPGQQPMVSNPPGGNLGIQTILQPSLKNLPRLKQYIELPNLIQPAVVAEQHKQAPLVVRSEAKVPKDPATLSPPKIKLPLGATNKIANLVE